MDTLEKIRQKRLKFFSHYIVTQAENTNSKEFKNDCAKISEIPINEKKQTNEVPSRENDSTTEFEQNKTSADILCKIFKSNSPRNHSNVKLNQSISLDETKHTFNNHKLEEFKNIVESSYQNHVLNKSDNELQLTRRFSVQSTNSFQAWNFSLNSLDESFKNSSMDIFSNEKNNGLEVSKIDALNNSVFNCKIPYMSAYNIYEQTEDTENPVVDKVFDSLIQAKKLTSNGSSATTSPTSLSSGESIKNVNQIKTETIEPNKMEVKPPETPKTSNLTFRKNLMRKSIESSRNSTNQHDNELNLIKKPNKLPSLEKNDTEETIDLLFNLEPKLSERKNHKKPKTKNIFNCIDDLTDNSDFVHDHSDEENTLDIFSNDEEFNQEKDVNLDLKIDLSQLNNSDEEEKYHYVEESNPITEIKPSESSFNSSTRQQIKPDIIPNLVLDQIDDDRSVSVAVSLAKSMCKEIDYKEEMEAIICDEINDQKKVYLKKNSEKSTPIDSNRVKIKSENNKQENKIENLCSSRKTNNLRPPTNSAQSIVNNPDKPNLYRKKTVLGSYREKDADSIKQNNKPNNVPIQSLDLFTNKPDQSKQCNDSKKLKKTFQKRVPKWESAIVKRPSSASLSKSLNNFNRPISAGILTYSKLIEIESNIQKETGDQIVLPENNNFKNSETDELNKTNIEYSDKKSDWLNLPHEIWLRVLRYLKQCDLAKFGQTCKLFNDLYKDNSLWRKIELKYEYNVKDEWLDWIGKRRPNELNIVQCSGHVSLNGITGMFKNIGENLQKLNLSRCSNGSLSGDNFALQASIRCPNVTCLDLSWTLLSNQTLKLIVDSFRKIESINLSGCNMIQEDGFNQLLIKHGKSLKNLEISGCIHFSSEVIYNIGCYCREIEKLNISNCHRIRNESIIEACPQWIKLRYIDLRGIKNIKNNCISNLVRKCPHLEGLSLGECVHISDASVLEIATYRSDLKQLDLCNCKKISDASIRSMAGICSKLEFLNLKGTNLTDIGLITLSDSSFIKKIEDLNLSFLPISELVLIKILKNAASLKKIHLYGCYNIKHLEDIKESVGISDGKGLEINI